MNHVQTSILAATIGNKSPWCFKELEFLRNPICMSLKDALVILAFNPFNYILWNIFMHIDGMCLAVFALDTHPNYQFFLAFNREESFSR